MGHTRVACPHCQAVFTMNQSLPVGQRVKCSHCGTHFTVGPIQEALAAGPPPLPSALPGQPDLVAVLDTPARKGISWTALLCVLLGALIFVGGGVALVIIGLSAGRSAHKRKDLADKATNAIKLGGDAGKDSGVKPAKRQPLGQLSHYQRVEVDKTVERGVAYLKSTQKPDGTWPDNKQAPNNPAGLAALAGLTLLECGAKKDDPAVKKVADYLRRREAGNNKIANTYDVSLAILFFDRLGVPQDRGLIQKLALRLVAGQKLSGGWDYPVPVLADPVSGTLASLLEKSKGGVLANPATSKLEVKEVDPSKLGAGPALPAQIANLPVWRADAVISPQLDSNNSTTQFAILALWAAKTWGAPVERPLARVVARFHKTQNADGSWGYQTSGAWQKTKALGGVPGAMTCAGLLGLAVGQGLVNEARGKGNPGQRPAAQQDPAIQRGLNFLAKQVADPHKPWENASGAPLGDLYFMWSVERVAVIFGLPRIGGKDWYGWGAEKLVANEKIQGDKGHWENSAYPGGLNPVANTCLALLFLKQANLAKDLTSKLVVAD
jgi:predicted Zn finger-like uncharacterized protein